MSKLDKSEITKGKLQYHLRVKPGDVAKYVLLPGDPDRVLRIAKQLDDAQEVVFHREYRTVTGTYKGIPVSATSTGIGCPSAAIAIEELANVGSTHFIRVGSTGALQPEVKIGDVVISTAWGIPARWWAGHACRCSAGRRPSVVVRPARAWWGRRRHRPWDPGARCWRCPTRCRWPGTRGHTLGRQIGPDLAQVDLLATDSSTFKGAFVRQRPTDIEHPRLSSVRLTRELVLRDLASFVERGPGPGSK